RVDSKSRECPRAARRLVRELGPVALDAALREGRQEEPASASHVENPGPLARGRRPLREQARRFPRSAVPEQVDERLHGTDELSGAGSKVGGAIPMRERGGGGTRVE